MSAGRRHRCEYHLPHSASIPEPARHLIVLISVTGSIIATFETDRTEFAPIATYDRDRIFSLSYAGNLATWAGVQADLDGAVYVECKPFRINMRSINAPRKSSRRRKTADILPFRGRVDEI